MKRAPILVALILAACGEAAPQGLSTGPGITGVVVTTSGGSTSGESSSTGPADDSAGGLASSSTGPLRDVGTPPDFESGQPIGCKGKVDLLFLISREHNMDKVQKQLLASFPGFVDTIEEKLEGFDVHVMAANPDGNWPGFTCESAWWGCPMYFPSCGPYAEDWVCNESVQEWQKCDSQLGAGITFNAGGYATNKRCELYGGNRYIISGEPNLDGALECIAKAGSSGPDPAIGDALIAALSYKLNGPGHCNDGFLRDDALLVVVIVANTDDNQSQSHPYQQYDAIIAAKKDPSAVVVLGLVPFSRGDGQPPPFPDCIYDSDLPTALQGLLSLFTYRVRGNICAPTYATFFDEAAGKIADACGSFIPQ